MSSKTVKITNGKILNYKISAPNYKTIYGSQLITADGTITKNMIPEISAEGVYSLGDRIGDISSFVCYFNSTNPETLADQKYAVFVLDAQYRTNNVTFGDANAASLLPQYSGSEALSAKESATYNTDVFVNNFSSSQAVAVYTARTAALLSIGGVNYQSQLPNAFELQQIFNSKATLDDLDPTLTNNIGKDLTTWVNSCSSNVYGESGYITYITNSGNIDYAVRSFNTRIVPVFEIPVN